MLDQRSKYSTNLTLKNWNKVKNKAANKVLDKSRKEAAKKKRLNGIKNELQRLREVELQFKQYRDKTQAKFKSYAEYKPGMGKDFYNTREWRELRWKVVSRSNGCCSVCGRNNKEHSVILHVDHIKPRSKYPQLELVVSNMQVLCEECNIGKGAKIQTF